MLFFACVTRTTTHFGKPLRDFSIGQAVHRAWMHTRSWIGRNLTLSLISFETWNPLPSMFTDGISTAPRVSKQSAARCRWRKKEGSYVSSARYGSVNHNYVVYVLFPFLVVSDSTNVRPGIEIDDVYRVETTLLMLNSCRVVTILHLSLINSSTTFQTKLQVS